MRKITFQTFLSGTPARDYIFQKTPYEEQIMQAANMIKEADYVLMGAGAGLSTAAGAVYGGIWFQENFKEFQETIWKWSIYARHVQCRILSIPRRRIFLGLLVKTSSTWRNRP